MRCASTGQGQVSRAIALAAILALVLQGHLVGFGASLGPGNHDGHHAGSAQAHEHHHAPAAPVPADSTHHPAGCCILGSILGVAVAPPPSFIAFAPPALTLALAFILAGWEFVTRRLWCLPIGARAPPRPV
ncbi:DUF2946 family protein [Microvirga tunisiensis]|uniref:DUF2946 domain-containing protein n=1 Tax=Microvirga tunisiensis TaxID=2108360 RepID=A0A5N7MSZ6_9HYPH|nr:hypothetical protein [Microvirga tunisiensis]MPR11517.1 hypothetical protein [Microvirga tunisiensis]MPR29599.1 hypothetical protein [Microvirga tunisiensis]